MQQHIVDQLNSRFGIHPLQHVDFCAWMLGLPEGAAAHGFDSFTSGEKEALLTRLAEERNPTYRKALWIEARHRAHATFQSVQEQGAEWLR